MSNDNGGWVDQNRAEPSRWLAKADFAEGKTVQGKLADALVIADEDDGTYRVAYVLTLTATSDAGKSGEVVAVGERHALKVFRALNLGDEVRWTSRGERALKGGRSMLSLDVKSRAAKEPGRPIADLLKAAADIIRGGGADGLPF